MANVLAAAVSCVLLAASVPLSTETVVYSVGDERGWAVPSGNGTETYNHWSKRNRFQVGDVLGFKYGNDSVLLVTHDDYKQCSTARPESWFTDGDTKFTFDRVGIFYFISGVPGHCKMGQRMIVHVMANSALAAAPSPAKAPAVPTPAKAPIVPQPSVGGAYSPVVSAPETPTYGSSSSISSPSPLASGASRRALAASFSIVIGLLGATMVALASS